MKITVRKEPVRQILKWSQRVLFACAVLLLGYCGFVVVDSWHFQRRASRDLDRLLRERSATVQVTPQPEQAAAPKVVPVALPDGLIGRIEIPRLRLSVAVMEGVDETTLRRAAGHIPGTALPGDAGNVGLAGHRDTFFRRLKDVRVKDEIQVSTGKGSFKYQVVSLRIVDPENVGVLAPSGENVLTLVTCYPFYFIGPGAPAMDCKSKTGVALNLRSVECEMMNTERLVSPGVSLQHTSVILAARILVIDDNESDVYLLDRALKKQDFLFELVHLLNGDEALAFIGRQGHYADVAVPNLILLDLNLSKYTGEDILRKIRGAARLAGVPVCVWSSSRSRQDEALLKSLGVSRFIPKPSGLSQFMEIGKIIEDLLERAKPGVDRAGA